MTTLAGLTIAARYNWDGLVQRLAFVFFMMGIATVLMVLIKPSQGIMTDIHVGAWRGPFPEKNYLGGKMSQGLAVCMCAYAMRPKRFWLWIPAGLLCFFLVIMSTSKTALLVSILSIGIFMALRLFRRFPILRLPVLYGFVAATTTMITLYLTIPDELFGLIGKDATFTGRTDIWGELILAMGHFGKTPLGRHMLFGNHFNGACQQRIMDGLKPHFRQALSGLFSLQSFISLLYFSPLTGLNGAGLKPIGLYWR